MAVSSQQIGDDQLNVLRDPVSGVLLLIAYPTKALTNPVFYVKLSFIALALVGIRYIARSVFGDPT
ncbi:MAG TPA: hypothetical protein VK752_15925, partial [Bryobacteraceae bacterium]|nr:hypothetical protein [Bryobacteraceae bacterium]